MDNCICILWRPLSFGEPKEKLHSVCPTSLFGSGTQPCSIFDIGLPMDFEMGLGAGIGGRVVIDHVYEGKDVIWIRTFMDCFFARSDASVEGIVNLGQMVDDAQQTVCIFVVPDTLLAVYCPEGPFYYIW